MKTLKHIQIINIIVQTAVRQRSNSTSVMKLFYPSADRNKEPILTILQQYIPLGHDLNFLEISSGSGQHVAHFAQHFPHVTFHPSEFDFKLLKSIAAYAANFHNIQTPIRIDITKDYTDWSDKTFRENSFDYMYNSNMIHITAMPCTIGLFKNAGKLLKLNGILFTYGPYAIDGTITPASNVQFDKSLRAENPDWGLRDVRNLEELALESGIKIHKICDMPANNKMILWKKYN